MQNRRKLHRIAHLMVASLLFSLAACATSGPSGSMEATRQKAELSLYKQCMHRNFLQPHPSLRYIAEGCRAWARTNTKGFP